MNIRSLPILAIAACIALSGCGKPSTNPASQKNRVVEWELSDFTSLNPYNYTDANAGYTIEQIYQRLIAINRKTMKYDVPWLADSMPTQSADHLTFDFRIRKDVKWADGKPLTGDDVIFSLKALKNPFNVLSAQKRVYVDAVHSAELIDGDPYRVRFKLWKPYVLALPAIFGDVLDILPKHILDPKSLTDQYSWDDIASIVESAGNKQIDSVMLAHHKSASMSEFAEWFSKSELGRSPQYIQGSGPYMLNEWVTQQYVRLVRNPNYVNHWGPDGEALPDTLLFKTISDYAAAVTALKARDVDLIGFLQPQYWVGVDTARNGLARAAYPLGTFLYIGFNHKSPIFRDRGVRWAMAHMIDRDLIIKKLMFGMGNICESPVTSTHLECNHDLPIIRFDPALASHILDSLDWKDHDGDGIRDKMIDGKRLPFKFAFTVNAGNETRKKILLVFAEALRKIGIDADVNSLEWSVFIDRLRDHHIDAHYGGWVNDAFESDLYQTYHSSQARNRGSNYDSYNNPEADRLMEAIRQEFDEAKRLDLQRKLQQLLYDDQATLFLWEPLNPSAWVDRFDNVSWDAYRPGYNIATWKVRGAGVSAKAAAW